MCLVGGRLANISVIGEISMKVQDLINQLRRLPSDFDVYITVDGFSAMLASECKIDLVDGNGKLIADNEVAVTNYSDVIVIRASLLHS